MSAKNATNNVKFQIPNPKDQSTYMQLPDLNGELSPDGFCIADANIYEGEYHPDVQRIATLRVLLVGPDNGRGGRPICVLSSIVPFDGTISTTLEQYGAWVARNGNAILHTSAQKAFGYLRTRGNNYINDGFHAPNPEKQGGYGF